MSESTTSQKATKRLADKVAIVTGSSSSIGQGIAARFGRERASVVVNYHSDQKGGEETARKLKQTEAKPSSWVQTSANWTRWKNLSRRLGTTSGEPTF